MWHRFPVGVRSWFGIELNPVSHTERLISAVGGFLGIFFILLASWVVLGDRTAALLIVASMGASAVLLFSVPHGTLSQPWSLIGGHAVSALIGVACARLVPDLFVGAALAVGLAIGAMHYLRCIHPPGGATAITAVIGGPAVHALGFQFLFAPVLLNVAIMLITAIGVNWFFAWRRYPAGLTRKKKADVETEKKHLAEDSLSHSDLEYAMRQINSVLGVPATAARSARPRSAAPSARGVRVSCAVRSSRNNRRPPSSSPISGIVPSGRVIHIRCSSNPPRAGSIRERTGIPARSASTRKCR